MNITENEYIGGFIMAKLYINANNKKGKINAEIYGHFSEHLGRCIYEGIYVGEDSKIPNKNGMRTDVVEALKEIKVPVLRWPGGCFADEYHWKDGIGPKEGRKKMINTHWGGVVEDNSFGTHEFFELSEQLGCKVYINGNLGSGTVAEMSEWVEYMTFEGVSPMADLRVQNGRKEPYKVDYFGVGNENWGCGGNMRPEHYANEYRRYQTYVRNYKQGESLYKIACGANVDDYHWTEKVLETCNDYMGRKPKDFMNGLSLHYYTIPGSWENKKSALIFNEEEYYETLNKTLKMEELIKNHGAIMDKYDPDKTIGMIIDEWGTWFESEPGTNPGFLYQQNTMRDALVAGINLNIFNKNCDRVKMANLAQVVNVLQAVILTEGDKMIKTPTYHVFNMYKYHQDAQLVDSYIENKKIGLSDEFKVPNLHESVSMDDDGNLHITITNLSLDEACDIETFITEKTVSKVSGEIVTEKMNAYNTFEQPTNVKIEEFNDITVLDNTLRFTIPACSVMHITVK